MNEHFGKEMDIGKSRMLAVRMGVSPVLCAEEGQVLEYAKP